MAKLLKPKVKANGKRVALDDGHGRHTPGKRTPFIKELGRSIRENEFNEAVVSILAELLLEQGFEVLLVAPTDADTSLNERTRQANAHKCDIYVSVHYDAMSHEFDASTASGHSIFIYPGQRNKESGKLAEAIANHLRKGTTQVWRGIREANFHVLRETHMPAILSENGFMDDEREAMLMIDGAFRKEVANEHFLGIMEYFGFAVKKAEPAKEAPKPVVKPVEKPVTVKPETPKTGGTKIYSSIVDYLNANKRDSSFAARKKLAGQYGIKGYTGTASQNKQLLDYLQNGKPAPTPAPKPSAPSTSLPNATYRAVKPYPNGAGVRAVQQALASVYYYPDKGAKNNGIDGVYGPKTANAVKRFQSMHGLKADGIYGPETRKKLANVMK